MEDFDEIDIGSTALSRLLPVWVFVAIACTWIYCKELENSKKESKDTQKEVPIPPRIDNFRKSEDIIEGGTPSKMKVSGRPEN